MSGILKCRKCGKPVLNEVRVIVPGVRPNAVCGPCVAAMQRQNNTPTLITDWAAWYKKQVEAEGQGSAARIRTLEEEIRALRALVEAQGIMS